MKTKNKQVIKITKGEQINITVQPLTEYEIHLVNKNGESITTNFKPIVKLQDKDYEDQEQETLEVVLDYSTVIIFEQYTNDVKIFYCEVILYPYHIPILHYLDDYNYLDTVNETIPVSVDNFNYDIDLNTIPHNFKPDYGISETAPKLLVV